MEYKTGKVLGKSYKSSRPLIQNSQENTGHAILFVNKSLELSLLIYLKYKVSFCQFCNFAKFSICKNNLNL